VFIHTTSLKASILTKYTLWQNTW